MNAMTQSPLLQFSREINRKKTLQPALAQLQKSCKLNPNIILYCCWCGESGRGKLTKKDIQALINSSSAWHEQIVLGFKPTSALPPHKLPDWLHEAQAELHKEAQTAEQIEQRLLCDAVMKPVKAKRIPPQKLEDACNNIATYCKVMHITLTTSGCRAAQQILIAAFPHFNPAVIEKLSYDTLGKSTEDKTPFQQRSLI